MLTLLCTAPQSAISSPVEGPSSPSSRAPPPNFSSTSAVCDGSCSSPTSSRKVSLPLRRPSIRKRIQSISRASGASIDKATATLTSAAGSSFSFLRHASSSGSGSPSPSRKSPSSHVRGASTSSFASGKSSSKSSSNASSSSPSSSPNNKSRLNILNIGPPSAFKHEFHLGPNSRNDGTWDESRWRRVFGIPVSENTPIIDVVSSANAEQQPRTSTSSERHHQFLSRSHSQSHAERPNNAHASHSSPNLLSIASSPSSPSPASGSSDGQLPEDAIVDKTKTTKAAKRASLVKRKPVPPLYPEDEVPVPATSPSTPAPMTFMLMPDVPPSQFPETAPAGKTTFNLESAPEVPSARVSQEQPREREERLDTQTSDSSNAPKEDQAQTTAATTTTTTCPAHICILHNTPAPTPPPRRHTLAHMQARALGRGLGDVPSRPAGATVVDSEVKPKSRPRPVPIVAPSPGTVSEMSPGGPALPPGLSEPDTKTSEENAVKEEEQIEEDTKTVENENNDDDVVGDSSPRPSFSSLVSGTGSHSSSSSSGSDGCEPRTPTDERRISAGSTNSMNMKLKLAQVEEVELEVEGDGDVTVTIVTDADEEEENAVGQTPTTMRRRVSKRPNPPARRVETSEDSIYVTADEADEA